MPVPSEPLSSTCNSASQHPASPSPHTILPPKPLLSAAAAVKLVLCPSTLPERLQCLQFALITKVNSWVVSLSPYFLLSLLGTPCQQLHIPCTHKYSPQNGIHKAQLKANLRHILVRKLYAMTQTNFLKMLCLLCRSE